MTSKVSRNIASTIALLAALGVGTTALAGETVINKSDGAQAQSSTDAAGNDAAAPSATETGDLESSDAEPSMNPTQAENESAGGTDGQMASEDADPVAGQIIIQDDDTILVSSMIGANVETPEGEVIGDINDVLASKDGTVTGIVIGVGGFLGIGEKDVAIEFGRIELNDRDGAVRLVLAATAEELEAAPDFKTAESQRDDSELSPKMDKQQHLQEEMDRAALPEAGTGATEQNAVE